MLVYGDAAFTAGLPQALPSLRELAEQALAEPDNLDRLRTLLITCGQVEQGAHDVCERNLTPAASSPLIHALHAATAHAADAFYSLAWRQATALPPPLVTTTDALHSLLGAIDRLDSRPDLSMTVKVPEGFNLHALYPEQYLIAAGRWLADHTAQQACGATVVGIRSIGTTLAAVVSSVLAAAGWRVNSLTVRPGGHPFVRRVDLAGLALEPGSLALVVDEGPGISGSSMAAVAAALVEAGFAAGAIAFLPGHPNAPGGMGSEAVRQWWQKAPRYVATVEDITFAGRGLPAALAGALPEPVIGVEDFSGGLWRRSLYDGEAAWPPICNAFERMKYRYTLDSGHQVLFKYLGLAAGAGDLCPTAAAAARLLEQREAELGSAPVLATTLGFVAVKWQPGAPLTAQAATPELGAAIGGYIARAAGLPLTEEEFRQGTARLAEMLAVNAGEALGEEGKSAAQSLPQPGFAGQLAYGDGHMQPYEWIATPDGRIRKVDNVGHDCDHTLVGKQPIAWDVAGALVEWELDAVAAERLLRAMLAAGGKPAWYDSLTFYRAAYLALRAGQCKLAADFHDPYERERLLAAYAQYRRRLAAALGIAATDQDVR